MSIRPVRWKFGFLGGALLGVMCGCAVTGVGYDGPVGVGYVGGYYEPYGYEYGGWGGGYRVGPERRGARGPGPSSHAYRAAPASRPTPSIPGRRRGR